MAGVRPFAYDYFTVGVRPFAYDYFTGVRPFAADYFTGVRPFAADYFTGAPRVEACNVTGDGWGGKAPCEEPYCGRLNIKCPFTKNDYELQPTQSRAVA